MSHIDRQNVLANRLRELDLDAIILTNLANIQYLTGFRGSSAMAIFRNDSCGWLITDFRYAGRIPETGPDFHVIISSEALKTEIVSVCSQNDIHRLGFESDDLTYLQHQVFQENLQDVELVPLKRIFEPMREIKDRDEIEAIRKALSLAEAALGAAVSSLYTGITESELAALFEFEARKRGSERVPFATIVAFGEQAATPHAEPGDRRLSPGDIIKIDCGTRFKGYCSDLTRTFFWQKADPDLVNAYETVLAALEAALGSVRPGSSMAEIDNAARSVIDKSDYRGLFLHSVGHGLGIEVHESPRVAAHCDTIAKTGMVFTIEPGIYIPERGGIRIEDVVTVISDGYEVLTTLPRELTILQEG